MKNLPRSLSRYAKSTNHIQNQVAKLLKAQGKTLSFNEQRRLNISIHNAKVRENREILKDLIKVNCFLAKQQLAFRSNDESSTSSNRGNYVELLHTLAAKDERLARHLETSTVFSGFSNIIQNDFSGLLSEGSVLGIDDLSTDRRAAAIVFYFSSCFHLFYVCLFYMAYSQYYLVSLCSAVSAQLCSTPKMLTGAPLTVIYTKSFWRYATSRGRMAFKTKYLIADTILAESGP